MKITWTIAALATNALLVDAQQAPRTPPAPPSPTAATAPAPRPAAVRPGQWLHEFELPTIAGLHLEVPLTPLPALAPHMPFAPMEPLVPLAFEFPSMAMSPMLPLEPLSPLPAIAPSMPMEPMFLDFPQGQGPTRRPARTERSVEADLARALAAQDRAAAQMERELNRAAAMQEREFEREMVQVQRSIEAQERAMAREVDMALRSAQAASHALSSTRAEEVAQAMSAARSAGWGSGLSATAPASWAPQDVADSAWKVARELFNRGEYGQSVQAFRALSTRYPNSTYAPEAAYYQAFALYRIGGTNELREALAALDAQAAKYPNPRTKAESATLATRIRGVLAARGDADAKAWLARAANEQGATCDREEQAVQAEAMNALSRSDAGNVNELITRVLARKDECAIPLRRTAVFLVGNRRDAQAVTILAGVARNDPSVDVKVEAIGVIARLPNEEGVAVLEELTRSDDERIQRAAVRALVRHPSARARTSVRSLVERDDVSERVRSDALSAFDSERATADDVAWLRALYARVTTTSLKTRTLAAIVRVGGPEVDQWLATIARDDNQPSEIRATAMRRIGESMSVADLSSLYDGATQQRFRSEIISVLGKRKEDAATDKLIQIVKTGTDPSLRRAAINAVSSKNDARATQMLLEIINK